MKKIILINIAIIILLISLTEVVSFIVRKIYGSYYSYNLFLNNETFVEPCMRMKYNPFYSKMHDHKNCKIKNGYADGVMIVYDKFNPKLPNILTLGGSTTDGFVTNTSSGYTYPYQLNQICKFHKSCNVINAGNLGFGSTNELLRLITDILPSKYNFEIIVSLNGANDIKEYNHISYYNQLKFPFLQEMQVKTLAYEKFYQIDKKGYYFLPNLRANLAVISKFFFGEKEIIEKYSNISFPENYKDLFNESKFGNIADIWEYNVKSMHAIVESNNGKYFVFLQPMMGLDGLQNKSPENTNDHKLLKSIDKKYLLNLNESYKMLKDKCANLSFCLDISSIATPDGNNYADPRHHNEEGNQIIASEIFKYIEPHLLD